MLNNRFIIIFCLFICFLFSISAVSAMNHTDSVGYSVNDFSNESMDYISSVNDNCNNVTKTGNYSFQVNVTVNDFKKQNTYILSNYNNRNEFKGFKNKELLLNFTVFDEKDIPVKNGTKVSVYIFSKEYTSKIDSNGKVTIPVVIDTIGKFAFEVRYIGNYHYKNSRNFTYISIVDEEFESDLNNSESVSLIDNFEYNGISRDSLDIITFNNFNYNGISKKLTFIVPKIEGSIGDNVEVYIYAFFDDGTRPNMNLTVIFNGIKIPVNCINGIIKFNITLPNSSGIYSLDVSFNSSIINVTNNSIINKSDFNNLNNLEFSNNYYNGISMDKTSNPMFFLIIMIFSLFISYRRL